MLQIQGNSYFIISDMSHSLRLHMYTKNRLDESLISNNNYKMLLLFKDEFVMKNSCIKKYKFKKKKNGDKKRKRYIYKRKDMIIFKYPC